MNVKQRQSINLDSTSPGFLVFAPTSASGGGGKTADRSLLWAGGLLVGLMMFAGFQLGMVAQHQRTARAESKAATAEAEATTAKAKLEQVRQCINAIQ